MDGSRTRDGEDVGLERITRGSSVEGPAPRPGAEVAVLARLVGVLVVQEEEAVVLPLLLEGVDLLPNVPRLEHLHADEAGPAVHRYAGDGGGPRPNVSGKSAWCGC
jgi:hypothetical protein